METKEEIDETAQFETTSSDMPEVKPETQESKTETELANSEKSETEDKGETEARKPEDGADATAEQERAKKLGGAQKRINQLVKERETEKREKEALQRQIDDLGKKPEEKQDKQEAKEPVQEDFEDYDKYLDALDVYETAQAESAPEKKETVAEEKNADDTQPVMTDSQKTALAVIRESIGDSETPEDFDAVALNPEVPITGEMLEALAECDDPGKIMYHLGKNKELAESIASGTPAAQMRAIAKLDIPGALRPEKPVKTTEAPDPIVPVAGSDAQPKPIGEMTFSEFEAHQNKIERGKADSW